MLEMRSRVSAALEVCRVAKTRWPVSAAWSATFSVSRSRSSPIENHIRRLAEDLLQRLMEAVRVDSDFALADDRFLVRVDVLDRVLDGDDVGVARLVEEVDHRGQRGRLAGAGRPGHQHEPVVHLRQALDGLRFDAEVAQRLHLERNQAAGSGDRIALLIDVLPDSRDSGTVNERFSSRSRSKWTFWSSRISS